MKIATMLSVLAFATSAIHAQAPQENLKTKALSFGFNGSGSVGGKIWISDQHALTLSFGGATGSTTREAVDTSEIDDEYSSSNVGVTVGVEQHLDWGLGFSPFLTGGLSVGYNQYTNTYGSTTTQYESESKTTNVGLHAGVGVEYWFARRISVVGVQRISGTYEFGKYSSGLIGSPAQDSRSFSLGLGTTSLVLSLYL